jgi:hypothetical protein
MQSAIFSRHEYFDQHFVVGGEEKRRDEKACLKNIFLAYSSLNHFILAEKATRIAVNVTINDKYLIK